MIQPISRGLKFRANFCSNAIWVELNFKTNRFRGRIYPAEVFCKNTVMTDRSFFQKNLLRWHAGHRRPMPWKGERDPYKIWLSEIILQQTRVEQGLPYYEKFVAAYPRVQQLADAPLDEVLKLWEGLGYYSRARNLHTTARYVAQTLSGQFPDNYAGLRALKGVGDYTAAAIASFAYDLPHAVLDGNVYRVLARYFGIGEAIDTSSGKKIFEALAQDLLDAKQPGAYNQAIMDFGAGQCTPRQPACSACPLAPRCQALLCGRVEALPYKSKTTGKKPRFFAYAVFYQHDRVWVQRRNADDIWKNLYEFPLLELPAAPADTGELPAQLLDHFFPGGAPSGIALRGISKAYRQTLSHRIITAVFCEFDLPVELEVADLQHNDFKNFLCVEQFKLKKILAVPRIVDWFWQEKDVTLRLI